MDPSSEWLGAFALATTGLCLLGTVAWVATRQRDDSGVYWLAAGLLVLGDGLITLTGTPAALVPFAADAAAPMTGWLAYCGAVEFASDKRSRAALAFALTATALWIFAHESGLPTLRTIAGSGGGAVLLLLSGLTLCKAARTNIQRLLAASTAVPIGLLLVHPRLPAWGFDATGVVEIWMVALSGLGLLMICALLEKRTDDAMHVAEMRAEQLRLGALVGGLGTWTLDVETHELEWSDELYEIYGLTPGSPIPDSKGHLDFIAEEDRSRFRDAIARTIQSKGRLDIEFRIQAEDGEERYVHSRAQLMRWPNGHPVVVGTTMDVTAHRAALEELRRYRTQLEQLVDLRTTELAESQRKLQYTERLASIGTLTAGIAHQVNNPVGAILAAADFGSRCRDDENELQTLRRAIRDIGREARRCGEIVHDMQRFASDQSTDKKCVEIDGVLERVRHSLRRTEREADALFSLEFVGQSPIVNVSTIEIEQAVTNLIENAIQASGHGAHVTIERRTQGSQAVISIRDNGCGIESVMLGRVLDPFFTSRLDAGGTGLGLSVAHGIARAHGGDLSIDSEPGRGTTVELVLPIAG